MVTDLRPTGNQKPLEIFENRHKERHIGPLLEDVGHRYGRGAIGLGHARLRDGPETRHALPLHHPLERTPHRQSRLNQDQSNPTS
jgi:hypothetical protein